MRIFKHVPLALAALWFALAGGIESLQVNGAAVKLPDENAGLGSCGPSSPETRRCDGSKLQWCKYTGWATLQECSKDQECVVGKDIPMGGECRARPPPFNDLPIVDRPTNNRTFSKDPIKTSSVSVHVSIVTLTVAVTVMPSSTATSATTMMTASYSTSSTWTATTSSPSDGGSSRCQANSHRCYDNKIQDCVLREHWATRETCKNGTSCEENCDARGRCNPYCKAPAAPVDGIPSSCPANATRCNNNKIQTCNSDKKWIDREPCATGTICTENCSRAGCSPYCRSKSVPSALFPECEPGLQKCDTTFRRLFVCNKDRSWDTDMICDTDSTCVNDSVNVAHCEKQKKGYVPPPVRRASHPPIDSCYTEGQERCTYNPDRTQKCTRDPFDDPVLPKGLLAWKDMVICPENTFCWVHRYPKGHGSDSARCLTGRKMARDNSGSCTPGEHSCSENGDRLLVCSELSQWKTKKQCATPGGCKIDGPGVAHCERDGIGPPKAKREE